MGDTWLGEGFNPQIVRHELFYFQKREGREKRGERELRMYM